MTPLATDAFSLVFFPLRFFPLLLPESALVKSISPGIDDFCPLSFGISFFALICLLDGFFFSPEIILELPRTPLPLLRLRRALVF